jgi:hypothetical protein
MALAFEQQPKESDKAFAAFSMYLSLGPDRSLVKTAAKLGRSKVLMEKWSSKFDWPARVAAYNAHMALVEREAAEAMVRVKGVDWAKRQEEVRAEAWAKGERLIALADDFLKRWGDGERLPGFESLVRAMELAFRLKGWAVGLPLDVKQVNATVAGPEGGVIRVEVAAALKKIYGRPLPGEVIEVQNGPGGQPPCKVQSEPEKLTEGNKGNEGGRQ